MRIGAIAWNLGRVLLILICCYQIALVLADTMQATRMLQGADSSKQYGQEHSELDATRVVEVLKRRGGDRAWVWLAGLGLLALLPYASSPKNAERKQ